MLQNSPPTVTVLWLQSENLADVICEWSLMRWFVVKKSTIIDKILSSMQEVKKILQDETGVYGHLLTVTPWPNPDQAKIFSRALWFIQVEQPKQ